MTTIDDSEDLARFGYRQELNRTLGSFSSFAAGFSYLSILTGLLASLSALPACLVLCHKCSAVFAVLAAGHDSIATL